MVDALERGNARAEVDRSELRRGALPCDTYAEFSCSTLYFTTLGKHLESEEPPWGPERGGRSLIHAAFGQRCIRIAPFVEQRYITQFVPWRPLARLCVWGTIKLANSGLLPETEVFRSSRPGKPYSLIPEPRSTVPLQWGHFGAQAIPSALADVPCAAMDIEKLLDTLNSILGTMRTLQEPGLERCLEHIAVNSTDFGNLYGRLRPYWHLPSDNICGTLLQKQDVDDKMRQDATRGGYIGDANVRPRRVWDLLSNRVLPFHVIPRTDGDVPDNIWTVSHSWVCDDDRQVVWTPINGHQWPVPIPKGTTLEHVRVELLNFGAEYVWIDVLCLRQYDPHKDEDVRKEEWKLDVPTIGHIYSPREIPCITYFNGLGLPFDPSLKKLRDARHWFNRVWTVQETKRNWLPGGMTGEPIAEARHIFRHQLTGSMPSVVRSNQRTDLVGYAMTTLHVRHSTNELDRVSALAYLAKCKTLPVYDVDTTPEHAWRMLIKHMSPDNRGFIFALYARWKPDDHAMWPLWEEFLYDMPVSLTDETLFTPMDLVDGADLHTGRPVKYVQRPKCFVGPFSVVNHNVNGNIALEIEWDDDAVRTADDYAFRGQFGSKLVRGSKFILIHCDTETWLVAQVSGTRQLGESMAWEVIKRGAVALRMSWSEEQRLQRVASTRSAVVVYLPILLT